MNVSTSIAQGLKKDMETTAKMIIAFPNSGASMKSVQEKYIALAIEEYSKSNPKQVAKRLAKNNVTELMKYYIRQIQA